MDKTMGELAGSIMAPGHPFRQKLGKAQSLPPQPLPASLEDLKDLYLWRNTNRPQDRTAWAFRDVLKSTHNMIPESMEAWQGFLNWYETEMEGAKKGSRYLPQGAPKMPSL